MTVDVIKYPYVTEKAMNDMDFENSLQFIVASVATKDDVRDAVEEQYEVTVDDVRTQNTMDGEKKATVTLSDADDAQEVASRVGVF